jgi:DNA damage-binding protein 1
MTDHPEPSLFIISPSLTPTGELSLGIDTKALSLHERIGRPAEFFTGLVVDQSKRIVVASVYTGKLRVLDFREGYTEGGFDVKYVLIFESSYRLSSCVYSIPELNILSLCFVPSDGHTPVLAILHRDYQQRVQLLSRDLNIAQFELSVQPGVLLQPTLLSSASFPQTDTPPILIPITATEEASVLEGDDAFPGGVLVVGGRKIILHKLAPLDWQERSKAKQKKESKRRISSATEIEKSREKEAARRNMKRKPFCSVEWPFGEVMA